MKDSLPTSPEASGGRQYWRSLDELTQQPDFKEWLHREFPQGASDSEGVNRRSFLKIMAASFGLAGLSATGCRRPEITNLPYARQPENSIPGRPYYYTTAYPHPTDSLPLVAETHQHRPTHLEGNRDFVPYGGGIHAQAQASLLNLYDPDRMSGAWRTQNLQRLSAQQVVDEWSRLHSQYLPTAGQGLAILAEPSSSPTRARLVGELKSRLNRAVWAEYSPTRAGNGDQAVALVTGNPGRVLPQLGAASRILSLDADFLQGEPGALGMARAFASRRRVYVPEMAKDMNRLYAVESNFTSTGIMADHRLRLSAGQVPAFAALLVATLLEQTGGDTGLANFLRSRAGDAAALPSTWLEECARDLLEHRGESLILAGDHLPVEVHVLVMAANALLQAEGKTLRYVQLPASPAESLTNLAERLRNGEIETLIIIGGNPIYNAPAEVGWPSAQAKAREVIRLGYYYDETGLEAGLNVATSHYLESWGDARTYDGTYLAVQPMIFPLFESVNELEVIARLAGLGEVEPYRLVQQTFAGLAGGESASFERFLSEGFLPDSSYPTVSVNAAPGRVRELLNNSQFAPAAVGPESLEVRLVADTSVGDGFYANNGWLQECPDPLTKLTWDNAVLISPALAEHLGYDAPSGKFLVGGGVAAANGTSTSGYNRAPLARIDVNGVEIEGPIYVLPGLPDWTVVLPLGYGRRKAGRVGDGIGYDAYPLLRQEKGLVLQGARLSLGSQRYILASTQDHWSMEGRDLVREATVGTFVARPDWVNEIGMESHSPPVYGKSKDLPLQEKVLETPRGNSLYEHPDFDVPPPNMEVWQSPEAMAQFVPNQQWGMSIDLNTCTGCQACIIACQSENNIPIVGKDQVARGREMHWFIMDRYFASGSKEANREHLPRDPQVVTMPRLCMHCETAPCEQVCPVNATVHDWEGLNVMAYNRCVGTRYCSNNCPYKVRRFNFFDYNKRAIGEFYAGPLGTNVNMTEQGLLMAMARNPDVTVRMRGVMEKCTFCVQRIQQAKIAAKVAARDSNNIHVPDGAIRTACQAACPTDAIVFGDVSDPSTEVSRLKRSPLNYSLLGYLNTRPRLTYLARLRNPNPRMPDAYTDPLTLQEYYGDQPGGHGHGHGSHGEAGHGEPGHEAHGAEPASPESASHH